MTHRQVELEDRLATLWGEVAQAYFLSMPSTKELLVSLEQRRNLVRSLLNQCSTQIESQNRAALLMRDHFNTLLEAEMNWLERTLASLQTSSGSHRDPVDQSRTPYR